MQCRFRVSLALNGRATIARVKEDPGRRVFHFTHLYTCIIRRREPPNLSIALPMSNGFDTPTDAADEISPHEH